MAKKFPKPPLSNPIFRSAVEVIRSMKVTMQKIAAGPQGVARRGTVLDVPEAEGKELIDRQIARAFDAKRDAKNVRGWTKAQDNNE